MIVVGFCSCYREGRLVKAAIRSLLEVEPDRLYIWEGPAGDPLPNEQELPESVIDEYVRGFNEGCNDVIIHRGRWRTDGRKRNDWLQRVKKDFPDQTVWAVVVDADEILVNGHLLRDRLEFIDARDRVRGADIHDQANPPMTRWPLHLVEHEGTMSIITGRVFRVDLVRSIDHSSSVITNLHGIQDGWGNVAERSGPWIERWMQATEQGAMLAWPPIPGETFIVHRSNLRHPLRAGLRMSEQEAVEFAKAQGK